MKVENGSHMVGEHDRSTKLEDLKFRREKLLARALAQMQSINAEVQAQLRNADINVSNDVKSEPLTPPTKDMGVDPISLETTTMGIADTLPEYHAGDNGLRERNLYSSDTKNERISISSSISLSQDSLSNSHFPGTKSLISTTKLLPSLLKDSFEPHSAKGGLRDFIQVDPPVVINWLPGGLAKTRPTGHRRGRPPRTDFEHSWQKVLLSLYDGRRRGRPPRQVLPRSLRPKGHRRGRPPNNYSSLEIDPVSRIFFIGFPDASCLLHVLLLLDGDVYPVQMPLYFFSRGEGVSSTPNPFSRIFFAFFVSHCYLYINEGAQRLKPGEPSAVNNPKTLCVLLRPKSAIFVFPFQDFQKFPPDSNVISGKIRSARAPDLQMTGFDLPLSALLQ